MITLPQILIVDPEPVLENTYKIILEDMAEVFFEKEIPAAYNQLKSHPEFRLVATALNFKGQDSAGLDFLFKLHYLYKKRPDDFSLKARSSPGLLVISASVSPDNYQNISFQVKAAGGHGLIAKPFDNYFLRSVVRQAASETFNHLGLELMVDEYADREYNLGKIVRPQDEFLA